MDEQDPHVRELEVVQGTGERNCQDGTKRGWSLDYTDSDGHQGSRFFHSVSMDTRVWDGPVILVPVLLLYKVHSMDFSG